MSTGSSKTAGRPQTQRQRLSNSVKLLLLWVAASDGKLEAAELEYVSHQFPDSEATITTEDFLLVIRNSDLTTIEKAVRTVAAESRELRTAFLDMAITMSMADRDIALAENHILRFYADALHLGIGILQKRFQAISGIELPEPGDPSDPAWWDRIGNSRQGLDRAIEKHAAEHAETYGMGKQGGSGMSIARAHTLLGLSLNATQEDIEHAYQNLARIFEVDRVEAMGAAAITVANARFQKIQEAYQLLKT